MQDIINRVNETDLAELYAELKNIEKPNPDVLNQFGTEFDVLVWKAILTIPLGATQTYKDIAIKINRPNACRAVANACGRNKLPLIIPCHRVVGSQNMGGYKWGLALKQKLLKFEKELVLFELMR